MDPVQFATWQAEQIRAFCQHEMGAGVRDAARILPLVGWDVGLAIEYLMDEIAEQQARDDRKHKANPWKVSTVLR